MARILIMDDDLAIRKLLKVVLENAGHQVVEASDGVSGLKLFRDHPTDLVITDILMPAREGLQTIIELKRDFPRVRILAISGGGKVGPDTFLGMARDFGAQGVLAKPFTSEELLTAVKSLLRRPMV